MSCFSRISEPKTVCVGPAKFRRPSRMQPSDCFHRADDRFPGPVHLAQGAVRDRLDGAYRGRESPFGLDLLATLRRLQPHDPQGVEFQRPGPVAGQAAGFLPPLGDPGRCRSRAGIPGPGPWPLPRWPTGEAALPTAPSYGGWTPTRPRESSVPTPTARTPPRPRTGSPNRSGSGTGTTATARGRS